MEQITGQVQTSKVHLLRRRKHNEDKLETRCGREGGFWGTATGQPITCKHCLKIQAVDRKQDEIDLVSLGKVYF